jgi:uncharacterized protein (TIGR03437 family)
MRMRLLLFVVGFGCLLSAQNLRSAAQLCNGASDTLPPLTSSQGYVGSPGSILPAGLYVMVICAIDPTGKYSVASSRISTATPLEYSILGYSISTPPLFWSPNTSGYELFLGTGWQSGSSFIQPDTSTLQSYLGPKMVGPSMPTLPTSLTVSSIFSEVLPSAKQGIPYSQSIVVIDPNAVPKVPPFTCSIASGSLPPGLSLNSAGIIGGTPTSAGTFAFSARIVNSTLSAVVQQYSLTIEQQLTISPGSASFQVQDGQIVGTGQIAVTVSGSANSQPITFTQTQPWIIATIQTAVPSAAVVCCPTTIIASVNPFAFGPVGSYVGSLGIAVPGFTTGTFNYSVQVLPPKVTLPPPYDPSIKLTSVSNAASFGKDFAVGSLATLFGSNMASGTYSAQNVPLPTSLGDVSVATCAFTDVLMVNCVAAQIVYASPTQINFLTPSRPANEDMLLSVFRSGHLAAQPLTVHFLTAAPGTFLEGYDCSYNPLWNDPSPCGLSWTHYSSKQPLRGAITDKSGSVLTSANPAVFGQQYTIWLTGLGVFLNGQPPQAVSIKIGGTPTNAFYDVLPSYTGPSPQFPGLYQINFPWPKGMMGSIPTLDILACADYKMEISFNIYEGSNQDPNVIQVPLLVKNGDVPCISK